ncbi:MAG: polysaccharide deacetylase [Lachnospiraceae bacterium]|nr:polysaccharide deacetylase [Lachnospiraceae bacterium]
MSKIHGVTRGTRRRRRNKNKNRYTVVMIILVIILLAAVGTLLFFLLKDRTPDVDPTFPSIIRSADGETIPTDQTEPTAASAYEDLLKSAQRIAGSYDYDTAIQMVQSEVPTYESIPELASFISECRAKKAMLVKWGNNADITHVFFHTLIVDADKAFSSYKVNDYNEVMTTIEEFLKIMESMYERGYVLVHLSDIAKIEKQPDGTEQMTYQPIYLPVGKIPFVLSVDDVSYYEYMNNTGFATRLIIDEDGRIINEMDTYQEVPGRTDPNTGGPLLVRDENGAPVVVSTVRGDFDVVPLLDRFVEEHPDFSYHGAKGTIALTGYNGVLGYKTSEIAYGAGDPNWPSAYEYKNIHIEEDRVKAKEVADALKAEGWKFASHTWGHMRMESVVDKATGTIVADRFKRDTGWWDQEVKPIIGDTDIIIFAFGSDIGSWRGYTDTNEAYLYLKSMGFDYFCNVDGSTPAWVQLSKTAGGTGYLRQGRRNLDGLLMFKQLLYPEKEILSDLFDVQEVFDRRRPLTPVNGKVAGIAVPADYDPSKLFK